MPIRIIWKTNPPNRESFSKNNMITPKKKKTTIRKKTLLRETRTIYLTGEKERRTSTRARVKLTRRFTIKSP